MATQIKASCPTCGDAELTPGALHLVTYDAGEQDYYEFFCPTCFELVRKPADDAIAGLLLSANVRQTLHHVPLELLELHLGPPLNVEDLMTLVLALQDDTQGVPTQ